jgi:DNA-binding transcriptional ArsR family regulator
MGDRIESLVSDEVGGCRSQEEDAERRREELRRLGEEVDGALDEVELRALSALGDETKHRIVRLLVQGDREAICVCEFDVVLGVSESAVSHALSELHEVGLAEREKRGRWRYYSATDSAERIVEALDG